MCIIHLAVISSETVVLLQWRMLQDKFGFINWVDKCKLQWPFIRAKAHDQAYTTWRIIWSHKYTYLIDKEKSVHLLLLTITIDHWQACLAQTLRYTYPLYQWLFMLMCQYYNLMCYDSALSDRNTCILAVLRWFDLHLSYQFLYL